MANYVAANTINIVNTTYENKDVLKNVDLFGVSWVNNSMYKAFYDCNELISVTNINSAITNMHSCYTNCQKLTTIPDIPANVTDLSYTFQSCRCLNAIPTIPSSVTNVYKAFDGCVNANQDLYIRSKEIANATDCFVNTTANKTVYIPFRYPTNHVYTTTYTTFIAAGYDTEIRKHGVILKNTADEKPIFTIIPDPVDALVVLVAAGGVQQGNSIQVEPETVISWSVSKAGYTTQNGYFTMTEDDKELPVTLEYSGASLVTENKIVTLPVGTYKYISVGGGGGGCPGKPAGTGTRSTHGGTGGAGGGSGYINVGLFSTPGETMTITIGQGGASGADGTATKMVGNKSGTIINTAGGKYGRYDTSPIMPRGGDGGCGGGAGGTDGQNNSGQEIPATDGGRGGTSKGNGANTSNINSTFEGGKGLANAVVNYVSNAGRVNLDQNNGEPGKSGIGLNSYSDYILNLNDFYNITESICYDHISGGGGGSGGLTPAIGSTPDWQGGAGAGGGGWYNGLDGVVSRATRDLTLYIIFYNTNTGTGGVSYVRLSDSRTLGAHERLIDTINIHENDVLPSTQYWDFTIDYYGDGVVKFREKVVVDFVGSNVTFSTTYVDAGGGQDVNYTAESFITNNTQQAGGKGGNGALLYYKLANPSLVIVPTPSDAVVTLTAGGYTQTGNGICVPYGTGVTYSVAKPNYNTVTNTITVTEDRALPVTLTESLYTFTVTPTPNDATVVLTASGYSQTGNSIKVRANTTVTWTVARSGWATKYGTETITADRTLPVQLDSTPTLIINPTPADATVTLTAPGYTQSGNSIQVRGGTTVTWSVTKSGYITQSGTYVMQDASETWYKTLFIDGPILVTSNQTATLPAGTYRYICVGGGGAGGNGMNVAYGRTTPDNTNAHGGGGGGSGQITAGTFTTTGETVTFTVGQGGTGGSISGNGTDGTASSIVGSILGTITTAAGGTCGFYGASDIANSGVGGNGYSGGGGGGHASNVNNTAYCAGGAGGSNGCKGVTISGGAAGGSGIVNNNNYNAGNGGDVGAYGNPGTPGLGLVSVTGISSNKTVFDTYSQNIQNGNYAACAYPQGGGAGGGSNHSNNYTAGSGGAGGAGYYNGGNPTVYSPTEALTFMKYGGAGGNGAIIYRQI